MRVKALLTFFLGLFLVLTGAVVPFMITLDLMTNNYLLCLLAYSASFVGLFIGLIGAIQAKKDELDD